MESKQQDPGGETGAAEESTDWSGCLFASMMLIGGVVFLAGVVIALVLFALELLNDESDSGPIQLPIVSEADARELADSLAAATEQQDVCYGWVLEVVSPDLSQSHVEGGSSDGPDTGVDPAACPRWLNLSVYIEYTAEDDEAEDAVGILIESSTGETFGHADLELLGLSEQDLLGAEDDAALIRAVAGLPLLAAERGLGPPVIAQPHTTRPPSADRPTGTPGSDFWRTRGWTLVGLLLLTGLGLAAVPICVWGSESSTPPDQSGDAETGGETAEPSPTARDDPPTK